MEPAGEYAGYCRAGLKQDLPIHISRIPLGMPNIVRHLKTTDYIIHMLPRLGGSMERVRRAKLLTDNDPGYQAWLRKKCTFRSYAPQQKASSDHSPGAHSKKNPKKDAI